MSETPPGELLNIASASFDGTEGVCVRGDVRRGVERPAAPLRGVRSSSVSRFPSGEEPADASCEMTELTSAREPTLRGEAAAPPGVPMLLLVAATSIGDRPAAPGVEALVLAELEG